MRLNRGFGSGRVRSKIGAASVMGIVWLCCQATTPAIGDGRPIYPAFVSFPDNVRSAVWSPAGAAGALCALWPALSDQARKEVRSVLHTACTSTSTVLRSSVWFPKGKRYDRRLLERLRGRTQLFQEQPPLGRAIEMWMRRNGAPAATILAPVTFAAVSVINFSAAWRFPVHKALTRLDSFYGRHRTTAVPFIHGLGASLQSQGPCARVSIPLENGAFVRLTAIGLRGEREAIRCLSAHLTSHVTSVRYALPRGHLSGETSLRRPLLAAGLRSVFSGAAQPFRSLDPNLALTDIYQASDVEISEAGIGVHVGTIAYTALGLPRSTTEVRFDKPFAISVTDKDYNVLAIGVVNDK